MACPPFFGVEARLVLGRYISAIELLGDLRDVSAPSFIGFVKGVPGLLFRAWYRELREATCDEVLTVYTSPWAEQELNEQGVYSSFFGRGLGWILVWLCRDPAKENGHLPSAVSAQCSEVGILPEGLAIEV